MERGEIPREQSPEVLEQLVLDGLSRFATDHRFDLPKVEEVPDPHPCGGEFQHDPFIDDLREGGIHHGQQKLI
jgi:hypothetical protein